MYIYIHNLLCVFFFMVESRVYHQASLTMRRLKPHPQMCKWITERRQKPHPQMCKSNLVDGEGLDITRFQWAKQTIQTLCVVQTKQKPFLLVLPSVSRNTNMPPLYDKILNITLCRAHSFVPNQRPSLGFPNQSSPLFSYPIHTPRLLFINHSLVFSFQYHNSDVSGCLNANHAVSLWTYVWCTKKGHSKKREHWITCLEMQTCLKSFPSGLQICLEKFSLSARIGVSRWAIDLVLPYWEISRAIKSGNQFSV